MRRGAGHNFHHLLKNGAKDDRETEESEEGAHHEAGPTEEASKGSASHPRRASVSKAPEYDVTGPCGQPTIEDL